MLQKAAVNNLGCWGVIVPNEVDTRMLWGQVLLTTQICHLTVVKQPNNLIHYPPEKSHS